MISRIKPNNGEQGNDQPASFTVIRAKRLLIEELVKLYKKQFNEADFQLTAPPESSKENPEDLSLAFIYRGKYMMIIRFDKNEFNQLVLKMTPAEKGKRQIKIIQLDEPQDNTPKLSVVPPVSESE